MTKIILFVVALAQLPLWAITFNIDAEVLKKADGSPMTTGVIVLVADVKDTVGPNGLFVRNGFSGPTATSFSGNDFLVARWNFSPTSPEYFGPGAFQAVATLGYSGRWQGGDPLRLYWFPGKTVSDAQPGAGAAFGTYRGGSAETGGVGTFAWITPAESATLTIAGETATVPRESTVSLAFFTTDANTLVTPSSGVNPASAGSAGSRMVVGRYVFYNGSAWDGNNVAANSDDDSAIAPDKAALLPGQTGSFENYTSYTRGLNGLMVDVLNFVNASAVSATDFSFKVGNNNAPTGWANAPAPTSITVRPGQGTGGSDRITIIWANNAIQKTWLQISVLATGNTGLSSPDVFYFGNAIGESINNLVNAQVNVSDEIGARNHLNVLGPVSITDPYDYNRDKKVNVSDEIAARNGLSILNAIQLISPQ